MSVHYAVQLDRYEAAFRLWLAWYRAAEMHDRTRPHLPEDARSRGVRPNHRSALVRAGMRQLRLAAFQRDRKLDRLEMLPEIAVKARRDALDSHERWLAANPCECSVCA